MRLYGELLRAWKAWDDWALTQRGARYPGPAEGAAATKRLEVAVVAVARANHVPSHVLRERMAARMREHLVARPDAADAGTSGRAWALASALGHT